MEVDYDFEMVQEFDEFCYKFAEKYKEYFNKIYPGGHLMAGIDLGMIFMIIRNQMPIEQKLFEYEVDPKWKKN